MEQIEQKQFYKLEFIKNITEHESEIRILYADDFEVHKTESGTLFYICRFSDGSQKTICADQFDYHHVVYLYRQEKEEK